MENEGSGWGGRVFQSRRAGRRGFLALALLVMAAGPGLAPAQSTPRYSANAVGFIKKTVSRQRLYQFHCPFTAVRGDGAGTAALMMGDLPNGSSLIAWDSVAQNYLRKEARILGAWTPGTESLFGQSFWLYVGNSATQDTFRVVFCGQVPDASTMPTSTVSLASADAASPTGNLNLVGFAYPVPVAWTNTTFAGNAGVGSSILVYDSTQDVFQTYTKIGADWSGAFTLQPGQGCWLRAIDCNTWIEPKPYDWP